MSKEKKPEQKKLPEEEKDLEERYNGFNKELLPILAKYELGLAAIPKILPGGLLAADPTLISVRGMDKEKEDKIINPES